MQIATRAQSSPLRLPRRFPDLTLLFFAKCADPCRSALWPPRTHRKQWPSPRSQRSFSEAQKRPSLEPWAPCPRSLFPPAVAHARAPDPTQAQIEPTLPAALLGYLLCALLLLQKPKRARRMTFKDNCRVKSAMFKMHRVPIGKHQLNRRRRPCYRRGSGEKPEHLHSTRDTLFLVGAVLS